MPGQAKSSGKIIWLHDEKIINYGDENTKKFIFVFSKVVKHLEISELKDFDFTADTSSHTKKFCNHQSVLAFGFFNSKCDDVLKEINS